MDNPFANNNKFTDNKPSILNAYVNWDGTSNNGFQDIQFNEKCNNDIDVTKNDNYWRRQNLMPNQGLNEFKIQEIRKSRLKTVNVIEPGKKIIVPNFKKSLKNVCKKLCSND